MSTATIGQGRPDPGRAATATATARDRAGADGAATDPATIGDRTDAGGATHAATTPRDDTDTMPRDDRPLVVKLGGGADIDPQPLIEELARLEGPWILVHGGNEELTALSQRLGHPARFVTSPSGHVSRFTDAETVAHIQMAYRGRINNDLVRRFNHLGCRAVGLSGVDGGLIRARRKDTLRVVEGGRKMVLRGDHSGTITGIDGFLLRTLLQAGRRPVVTLPALADDGTAVNVDGDRAAAAIAATLGGPLVILSNVPGLLKDVDDPDSLVTRIHRADLEAAGRFAQGRFRKKIMAVEEALAGGVERVVLGSAHGERPLAAALAGQGTVIG